jgi:hypothetical protein
MSFPLIKTQSTNIHTHTHVCIYNVYIKSQVAIRIIKNNAAK